MCFQTGQSTPLSSARLPFFLSMPSTITLCKKPPTFPPTPPSLLYSLHSPVYANPLPISPVFPSRSLIFISFYSPSRRLRGRRVSSSTSLGKKTKTCPTGGIKINSKCWCLFILRFNVTTTEAPGRYVTPNTAMLTAVM